MFRIMSKRYWLFVVLTFIAGFLSGGALTLVLGGRHINSTMVKSTALEIDMLIRELKPLREGKPEVCLDILENFLDTRILDLTNMLEWFKGISERYPYLVLERAREYRKKYPRKTGWKLMDSAWSKVLNGVYTQKEERGK